MANTINPGNIKDMTGRVINTGDFLVFASSNWLCVGRVVGWSTRSVSNFQSNPPPLVRPQVKEVWKKHDGSFELSRSKKQLLYPGSSMIVHPSGIPACIMDILDKVK